MQTQTHGQDFTAEHSLCHRWFSQSTVMSLGRGCKIANTRTKCAEDKQNERYVSRSRYLTWRLLTLFPFLSSTPICTSCSFSFFHQNGKNLNYGLCSVEALVNDWKKRDWESGQANKIQGAESLYCHRVSVGSRRERNNLFLQLSLSFLSVFLLIYSLSLTFIYLPFLRPKSKTQL